jgi:hypothetical protein
LLQSFREYALHTLAILQGAFTLAKAKGGARDRRRQRRSSAPLYRAFV